MRRSGRSLVPVSSASALTNAATIFGTAGTQPPHGHEKRSSSPNGDDKRVDPWQLPGQIRLKGLQQTRARLAVSDLLREAFNPGVLYRVVLRRGLKKQLDGLLAMFSFV